MRTGMSLVALARQLLDIDINKHFHMQNPRKYNEYMWGVEIFEQTWGNTSGGFQGVGGCAMTTQYTQVLIPLYNNEDEPYCLVFFGGRFAYKVPKNNHDFRNDVANQKVAGLHDYKREYGIHE